MTKVQTSFGTIKECIGCGEEFLSRNPRQLRCKKNCKRSSESMHGARARVRHSGDRLFIGIDGEGVTRPNGEHIYDMLSVGSETLVSSDGSQLHYKEVFAFLYSQYEQNPEATFVGFFLGYDFHQWFRTMPEDRARILLTKEGRIARKRKTHEYLGPFPVDDGEWEFDILGMKRLRLRPLGSKQWMYINDTGPFFQTSFLNVIDPSQWDEPILSTEEFEIIKAGKADRGRRQTLAEQLANRAETAKYNTLENEVLARAIARLNNGFVSIGVKLQKDQWYGPGQAAQTWMRENGIPSSEDVQKVIPDFAWDAAQASYFGGWFEVFAHGIIPGTSYEYDINSAYPYIISKLPCLLHGKWRKGGKKVLRNWREKPYLLIHAEVEGDCPEVGAMLHRTAKHTILRPKKTRGWYWAHEVDAAIRAGIVRKVSVNKWVEYIPCDCPGPYEESMPELYTQRLRVGKNSPEGKAYKLIYNSAYGKHAQSIGSPRFANSVYASLITAGCRTMILDAIATHPSKTESLLMVATDGVYFREPHPSLEISPKELGKWDFAEKQNLTLFMPGLYWDDTTRVRLANGQSPKLKSRGISAGDLAERVLDLDTAFRNFEGVNWPSLEVPINFQMISSVQALVRNKWELAGTLVEGDVKKISASPVTKRVPLAMHNGDYWVSFPYPGADKLDSTPYDKTFGKPDTLGETPDTPALEQLLHEMLTPGDN